MQLLLWQTLEFGADRHTLALEQMANAVIPSGQGIAFADGRIALNSSVIPSPRKPAMSSGKLRGAWFAVLIAYQPYAATIGW